MATEAGATGNAHATSKQDGHFQNHEVVYISKDVISGGAYNIVSLKEDATDQSSPFRLASHTVHDLPEAILDEHLISSIPSYLQNTSTRKVHIVVSTGSGTGLASGFYQSVLEPLLSGLGLSSDKDGFSTDGTSYALTITEDAQSIQRFARDLNISTEVADGPKLQHTVILLSGDGGTIELLNGKAPGDEVGTTNASLPLIVTLPLGTGNALFHSLHKPLYVASDTPGPSPLVLGLRTLLRGEPKPLPSFKVEFSAGSRTIAYTKPDDTLAEASGGEIKEESNTISHLYGAIVASYGLHAQLVWESDTPEYRKHGSKRFGMVAAELMRENHAYDAAVQFTRSDGSATRELERVKHAYILATLVSNLEKTFTINPASRPLDGQLRLVHFGPVPSKKVMEIMMQAYNNGSHVGMEWETEDGKSDKVGYEAIEQIKVTTHEEDARWRKVCIDGTIVEIPKDGSMTVTTETNPHLQVLVHPSINRS